MQSNALGQFGAERMRDIEAAICPSTNKADPQQAGKLTERACWGVWLTGQLDPTGRVAARSKGEVKFPSVDAHDIGIEEPDVLFRLQDGCQWSNITGSDLRKHRRLGQVQQFQRLAVIPADHPWAIPSSGVDGLVAEDRDIGTPGGLQASDGHTNGCSCDRRRGQHTVLIDTQTDLAAHVRRRRERLGGDGESTVGHHGQAFA